MRVMCKRTWPYQVAINYSNLDLANDWCRQKFLKEGQIKPQWYVNNTTFCFNNQAEYTMFVLRWGS